MLQTGGTLADDEHGQCPGQRRQCLAQGGVGGVVQRTGAVIQNQNVRLAHQRTGDGEPLLLSAGKVASALLHRLVQPKGLCTHKVCGLCRFQRRPQVGVGGILVAPQQIGADGAAEELRLLHDHRHPAAQSVPGVAGHRAAKDLYAALGGIVKARDEVY